MLTSTPYLLESERQIGSPAIAGDSDTRAFVTETARVDTSSIPTLYSHVDYTVVCINHVFTMLVLYQLATRPIQLPS